MLHSDQILLPKYLSRFEDLLLAESTIKDSKGLGQNETTWLKENLLTAAARLLFYLVLNTK